MQFIADLHTHSRYSRATSRECNPENLYRWAVYKGLSLVGAGDFTHPAWREELREKLEPAEEEGLYRLREEFAGFKDREDPLPPGVPRDRAGRPLVRFVVSGEISTIYKKNGRVRKVHHLILLPGLREADRLSQRLEEVGNIRSDGRPILGLDSRQLLQMTLEASPEALFIPAHIWTPHFSVLGANSGFESIEECYADLTGCIYAVETGLSSDPPMNWRLADLDRFTLVSNSDAHSPANLAREATLFNSGLSYPALRNALRDRGGRLCGGTLEFFPEEGKYHYDGHRGCQVRLHPAQTRAAGGICPTCGRPVTVGVLHRVEDLADREEGFRPAGSRPYVSLVPLSGLIASALGVGTASKKVAQLYFSLVLSLGPELAILREVPPEAVARVGGAPVAEAIRRMRAGRVDVLPGFDGEYGRVLVFRPEERDGGWGQDALFNEEAAAAEPSVAFPMPLGEADIGIQPGVAAPENRCSADCAPAAARPAVEDQPAGGQAGLLGGLNEQQRAAVLAEQGPVVVIAGPGTGKTGTLVHRLAYLVEERGVDPARITAVTFTNKAAAELRRRAAELLGDRRELDYLSVGTFHGICLDMLRRQATAPLTVLDEIDARSVLAEVLREVGRAAGRGVPRRQREISLLKSRGILPSSPALPQDLQAIYAAYQDRLAEYGALDYDDLLLRGVELAEGGGGGEGQFTHLLVDEFQDVNPVQYRLVRLWAGDGSGLCLIGDPHQAIYGFRGADPQFFHNVLQDFPQARFYHLSLNYRSTPAILRAAGGVIAHNPPGPVPTTGNRLVAAGDSAGESAPLVHLEVPGEAAEGIALVREIGRLVGGATMLQAHGQGGGAPLQGPAGGRGEAWGFADIAVLCRTGRQVENLEEYFLKEGIPYRMVGRESFLEEQPVRDALHFSWCLVNPEDDFHLLRCLALASFGLRPQELAMVREAAREKGIPAWSVLTGEDLPGSSALGKKLLAFRKKLETYRDLAGALSPESLLQRWLEESGCLELRCAGRLLRVAARFDRIAAFLRGLVLAEEADHERLGVNALTPEAVTLMTMHAAKGLEFPVVFIIGVEDGLLPLRGRGKTEPSQQAMAEERRLFYVGLTRARQVLYLASARDRVLPGRQATPAPSPFLAEIPPDCLERRAWTGQGKGRPGRGGHEQLTLF